MVLLSKTWREGFAFKANGQELISSTVMGWVEWIPTPAPDGESCGFARVVEQSLDDDSREDVTIGRTLVIQSYGSESRW